MYIHPNTITLTVADYCNAYNRKEVLVDQKYQRNSSVWPDRAQSYLIETILRGFPMPKLALHHQTDIKSRRSLKFVVDGQQRTNAIVEFFNGEFALSTALELEAARGKTMDGLSQQLQEAFLSYPLQFDQFEAADDGVVREYFRRINSFTTPLNPEERRHANFQGNMKWFILKLAERHTDSLISLQTMSEREIVRMADRKLFAEIVHALINGVSTTSSTALDSLYRTFDGDDITREGEMLRAIDASFSCILGWRKLCLTDLVKKGFIFYSMILAVICLDSGWVVVDEKLQVADRGIHPNAENNLLVLSDALAGDDDRSPYLEFVKASSEKTNTKQQRSTRIKWLLSALTEDRW